MLEKIMDKIVWFLMGIGGILTIEEAISVGYVGVPASQTICGIALGCLFGSVGVLFIGGIVLSIKEVIEALVK